MRTIAIVNQKGGCGKTTTAIQLAAEFAKSGKKVLLVDLDAQSHCAAGLRIPDSRVHDGLTRMLASDNPPEVNWEELPITVQDGLDVLPASRGLSEIERLPLDHLTGEETVRLLRILRSFTSSYDIRILDCPPNLHLLTLNAFRAATEVLVPIECGYFAIKGAERQWEFLSDVVREYRRNICCHLLPTMLRDTELSKNLLAIMEKRFSGQILPTAIRDDDAVREATVRGIPVAMHQPTAPAAQDYEAVAKWLLDHPPAIEADPGDPPRRNARIAEVTARLIRSAEVKDEPPRAVAITPARSDLTSVPIQSESTTSAAAVAIEEECELGPIPIPGGVEFRREWREQMPEASVIGDFNQWTPGRNRYVRDPARPDLAVVQIPLALGTHQYMVHEAGKDPVADIHCSKLERNQYRMPVSVAEVIS